VAKLFRPPYSITDLTKATVVVLWMSTLVGRSIIHWIHWRAHPPMFLPFAQDAYGVDRMVNKD